MTGTRLHRDSTSNDQTSKSQPWCIVMVVNTDLACSLATFILSSQDCEGQRLEEEGKPDKPPLRLMACSAVTGCRTGQKRKLTETGSSLALSSPQSPPQKGQKDRLPDWEYSIVFCRQPKKQHASRLFLNCRFLIEQAGIRPAGLLDLHPQNFSRPTFTRNFSLK
ncbi:unnamed protein product [Protopolystoma xenopodis]|uniref:Uncharacterized protein n=1 Tax=Protopolystoma xenopodis TaxID=117903 RepID=A0A3S5FCP6_9PLAT|nr:unnamed protein product [Protopolystoma xenopodis]